MQIKDATYISYGGKLAREAWYEGTLVWQTSSFGWVSKPLSIRAWTEIAYGPTNTLVVAGNNGWSYSSNNGDTWSAVVDLKPSTNPETYNALTYGSSGWVMCELESYGNYSSKNFYTSNNILTGWTMQTTQHPFSGCNWFDIMYSNYHNKYIAVGALIRGPVVDYATRSEYVGLTSIIAMHSTNGINWLSGNFTIGGVSIDHQTGFNSIEEASGMANYRLIGCSGGGATKFGYSNDGGQNWTQGNYNMNQADVAKRVNLQTGGNWNDIAYGTSANLPLSGRLVGVNLGTSSVYQFVYSDDGINWYNSNYDGVAVKGWRSVVFGNGYFVALSNTGGWQAMSKDGLNWSLYQNMPSTSSYIDMTVANNRFATVVSAGTIGAATSDFIF
jgi:hypothetical protein